MSTEFCKYFINNKKKNPKKEKISSGKEFFKFFSKNFQTFQRKAVVKYCD